MAIPRALEPSGLVLVDKPVGPSSFAIVRSLRAETGARAGHTGTLDPFANGLLLVLLGAATRLARYLVGLDKRYLTTIDLRARTESGDRDGARTEEREPPRRSELEERLKTFVGVIELRIPAASAVKIGGERAYRLARQGIPVEMPLRRSEIYEARLLSYEGGRATIDLRVSTGTYVRSIADALGGHCETLRRLEVGPFSVEQADRSRILPAADALPFMPSLELDDDDLVALRSGRTIDAAAEDRVKLLSNGRLVGVGVARAGVIRSEVVMPV